ncbi:GNAT family N-acetyltransferase [Leptospira interrogans]|uniref:GNAT family N-acetyltransferase n=1 Tax=Leptospira interrogans TaxID=173 RepID=UPI0007737316|nr:GNAT family N-acetyltransferase [Leptospira interrogans]
MESFQIRKIDSISDIENAYPAFLELRPHLTDKKVFVQMVLQQISEGYCIHAICLNKETIACIGFRFFHMLAWGKILYIDDLITKRDFHGHGYGDKLLKHVIQIAKEENCDQVHLDTGYLRHAAHFVYLRNAFELNCHHLALNLRSQPN